ncbi:alpha-amylase [Shewanella sp. WXL01]|uniref:alpha-amylase family glycosyl hydrolase n=1 Tax=Shewanella sp. WXL01 TaxID=2709721 RepID=UPI00143832A8|nr:alpha-amylase family glycosyl hydrolase [Shewanella sp. WXL01]NKF50868.1 alpha-amylase [Shewanella sp. WXL01]
MSVCNRTAAALGASLVLSIGLLGCQSQDAELGKLLGEQSSPDATEKQQATVPAIYQDYLNRDVRDDIFYFVLPDRFNNGNPANDNGAAPGYAKGISYGGLDVTTERGFHGGDIKGIEQKLDYLQQLGVTAIWMTPILRNKAVQKDGVAHHGYWIVDFTEIDPHFGTNDELKQLIAAAHTKGIKVFFDIITNHTADVIKFTECHNADGSFKAGNTHCEYKSLEQVAAGDKYTPFVPEREQGLKVPEWLNDPQYYHNQGDSTFRGESSLNGDFNGLDDLDTSHPQVLAGMTEIYKNLITEFKPDGFRIDTVRHVDLEFWQSFSPAIVAHAKSIGIPQFHVFGEVYDSDPKALSLYTTQGKLPSVLDFGFQRVAADIFYRGKSPVHAKALFAQDDLYQDHDSGADLLMTFLGNHDMGRSGYFINQHDAQQSDADKLKRSILSHAYMFLSRGIPVIYYGDEQGFTGDGNDIYAREDMFASQVASYNDNALLGTDKSTADDNFDTEHPIFNAIAQLSELRKRNTVMRRGEYQPRFYQQDNPVFAFARVYGDTEWLMVFNSGRQAGKISLDKADYQLISAPDGVDMNVEGQSISVQLPRLSYAILEKR